MAQEDVERLKQGYEAFNQGDIERAFENFDDDIVWHGNSELTPAGGDYRGRESVANEWLKEIAENYDEFSVQPEEFIDGGDYVVMLGQGHAKLKSNGATVDGTTAHIWKFRDGKSVEAWFFGDTAKTLQAMQG